MAWQIDLHKDVKKFVASHPDLITPVRNWIVELETDPYQAHDGKMVGFQRNVYKKRFGKYRVLFEIIDDRTYVFVFDIDSRGDIYKNRRNK